MNRLKDIGLVAVATRDVEATVDAIEHSQRQLEYDDVLLVSDTDPTDGKGNFRHIKIDPFSNVGEWGRYVVFELHREVKTDHILLIHADGFVANPDKWDNTFRKYDYIGAPWPIPKDDFSYRDHYGNIIRVGNSVSLRSRRLLELPSSLNMDWDTPDHGFFHEDGFLCVQYRHLLQKEGIEFAPLDVACHFSRERVIPENKNIEPFAFHKWDGPNRKYPCFGGRSSLWDRGVKKLKKMTQGNR